MCSMGSMWFDVVRWVQCCAVKSIESSRRFEISNKVCSIIFLTIAGNVRLEQISESFFHLKYQSKDIPAKILFLFFHFICKNSCRLWKGLLLKTCESIFSANLFGNPVSFHSFSFQNKRSKPELSLSDNYIALSCVRLCSFTRSSL